jgi:hypothetical protein
MAAGFQRTGCHHIENIRQNQSPGGRDGGKAAMNNRGFTTVSG